MSISNAWLQQFHQLIEEEPQLINLDNKKISTRLGLSERQFFRKIKTITNLPPQKYLRPFRLKLAKQYLENGEYRTVYETAFAVGYQNVGYFIAQFETQFGKKPLQILKEKGWR